jgi:hypothetical protein
MRQEQRQKRRLDHAAEKDLINRLYKPGYGGACNAL